jgi:hypothetical protein
MTTIPAREAFDVEEMVVYAVEQDLADKEQRVRCNVEAARATMAVAKKREEEKDRRGVLAAMAMARQRCCNQFPLASFKFKQEYTEDRKAFTDYIEDAERRSRQVREDRQCRRQQANNRRSDDGVGLFGAAPPNKGGLPMPSPVG